MQCRYCKNQIQDGSVFCNWCGERQIKQRKKKDDIKVPTPRQLKSGRWNIELRQENQSATFATAEECIAWAKAIRAGLLAARQKGPTISLGAAMDKFIEDHEHTLSPSTLRGYQSIRKNRFQSVIDKTPDATMDWQPIVDAEAAHLAPKTVISAWSFAREAMEYNGVKPPEITLPQIIDREMPFLDYEQIPKFLAAMYEQPGELAALLALHSLRRSELLDVSYRKISLENKTIAVSGSAVFNKKEKLIHKASNKNRTSQRVVPIVIPRLFDLLRSEYPSDDALLDARLITNGANVMRAQINRVCAKNGLPLVGLHGLRRSFASLAYHLGWPERLTMAVGGWNDAATMHKFYIKLATADQIKNEISMAGFYGMDCKITNEITNT